jgi:dihydrolipoamide dehydrogenase
LTEKDIVIIGGGPGGYTAAIHAAHLGAKVALIERAEIGGTCLNRGCIPTKVLLKSVELLGEARKANDYGINLGQVEADFGKIMARKNGVVDQLRHNTEQLMKLNRIDVIHGNGRILTPNRIRANDKEIVVRKIIIATGSQAAIPPIPGTDLPGVLTTDDILELNELPQSLVVIGGGFVGVEFASILNALGTKVTVIEMLPHILEGIDEEIARRFAQILTRQGVKVHTGARVKTIKPAGKALAVTWGTAQAEQSEEAQMVLMATGRQPCIEELGLPELSLKMKKQAISVNEEMKTNIGDIYAVGDVLGLHMLAHVAAYEGKVAVENALGRPRKSDYRAVPKVIYTHPMVASVGITEKEAGNASLPYSVSKFPFTASGGAVAIGETAGLVKMICNAEDKKVLGLHILGHNADDLIAEGALAIQLGATAHDIAETIHAHPTLSEAVHEAAMGQLDGSIHFGRL